MAYFENNNIIPCDQRKLSQITIKQIISNTPPHPHDHVIVDNKQISQVQMIAQIKSFAMQNEYKILKVNDYTGSIDVKQWHFGANERAQSVNYKLIIFFSDKK